MRSQNQILTRQIAIVKRIRRIIASLITIGTLVPIQPASAQLLELATGALTILNSVTRSSQPQQTPPQPVAPQANPQQPALVNPKFTMGTKSLNGNQINICISNCLPAGSPVYPPGVVFQPAPIAQ